MNAAIVLLALACVNGYAQEKSKLSNKKVNYQIMTVIPRKKEIVMSC